MIACEIIIMSYITRRFLLKLFKKRDGYLSTMPSMKDCHSSHNLNLSQNPIIATISEAVPELPFDIITEILSWLPVHSLLRFKCVCKKWSSLIKDDYKFIVKHMDRASSLQLSYQHVWEPNKRSPIRYDEKFIYLSDVAGLFLEESLTSRVFRIRNYATQQVLYLPDAHEGTNTMGFAFNSSTGECKVACFYAREGDFGREVGFKILSIGKDDQWRTLMLPNQNHKSCHRQYRCATSQYDGDAHLIEIIRDGQDFKLEVQSFDLWSECFTITTLPRGVFLDLKKVSVIPWNQTVAVAERVEEALQVLVLEDFKEHNWNKIIVPLKFLKDDPVLKKKIRPRLAWSDELWFHNAEKNTIFVYDMKRGVIKETHTNSTEKKYFSHKPSLVTLKGMKNEY